MCGCDGGAVVVVETHGVYSCDVATAVAVERACAAAV